MKSGYLKTIIFIAAGLTLLFCIYYFSGMYVLRMMDRKYTAIEKVHTRSEVKTILNNFTEIKASVNDKDIWQSSLRGIDTTNVQVYRYQFYIPAFSIHVVYDTNDNVVIPIPTYE